MTKQKNKAPFDFVLDALTPLDPRINPMFGAFGVYVGEKIVLALRKKEDHEDANGVWIATGKEHHQSLKKELPSMQSIYILSGGTRETGWQMIPADSETFEEEAMKVCELILKGDKRIGKIPGKKKKKTA